MKPSEIIFTVTETHLRLLRRFNVDWDDREFGAPNIDPKRPYGNSDVLRDIAEILGFGPANEFGEFTDQETGAMKRLHKDTQTVLQIALRVGYFKAGDYVANRYEQDWRPVES